MSESPHPLQPYGTVASKCLECQDGSRTLDKSNDDGVPVDTSVSVWPGPRARSYDEHLELNLRFVRLEHDVLVEVHYDGED